MRRAPNQGTGRIPEILGWGLGMLLVTYLFVVAVMGAIAY